jgi:hypothetical protein
VASKNRKLSSNVDNFAPKMGSFPSKVEKKNPQKF